MKLKVSLIVKARLNKGREKERGWEREVIKERVSFEGEEKKREIEKEREAQTD